MKRIISSVLCMVFLTSCFATSQDSRYYTLSSPYNGVEKPEIKPAQNESWKLSGVTIPDMLNRPQMIIRVGANEVRIREYDRWAEPLDSMIYRVLTEDLSAHASAPKSPTKEWEISVAIEELDMNEAGEVTLKATWTIKTGESSQKYIFGQTERAEAHDLNAMVSTMNHLIDHLAVVIITN